MIQKTLYFAFLVWPLVFLAQIKGTIFNSSTKQPVPLVNIWIAGEDKGTTADKNGNFTLPQTKGNETIIFSAVGYADVSLNAAAINGTVIMEAKAIELDEVNIQKKKNRMFRIVNPLDEETETYFAASATVNPRMVARFIPYKKEYAATPFLKDIKFVTISRSPGSTFNVRLYAVAEDGSPGDLLYDENIIGTAKKKRHITPVDLSSLNIRIPKKGFFVAVEWLIIDSNRYDLLSLKYGRALDREGKNYNIYYDPPFKSCYTDKRSSQWLYEKGTWTNKFNIHDKKYYNIMAEVTLSD
ncbi:carboxypeptidase-like regulatory domain-containing protein [Flavobacterium sp. DGU11]|uniref:Carboxypeptidase-like regulatory domain-containing protein n=1 Tax=Flavobacterium arundinis TaxID=3139143 RepID=A0ABU9HSH1_9FLAO